MNRGRVVALTLPADDSEVAHFFASSIKVTPQAFVAALHDPEALWKSSHVPQVVRFSDPPALRDLAELQLDDGDVDAIRDCRPGDCSVKLSAEEMARLQQASSIQDEFRRLLLERVRRYVTSGLRDAGDFVDHETPVDLSAVAARLLMRAPWLSERAPRLTRYLQTFPSQPLPGVDSFFYWIKTTHTLKPTIQVVHVTVERRPASSAGGPEVIAASRQVFASHYVNGYLGVSMLLHDPAASRRYLVYATRADVDGISGWLGRVRRLLVEKGVRRHGVSAFEAQRRRVEAMGQAPE